MTDQPQKPTDPTEGAKPAAREEIAWLIEHGTPPVYWAGSHDWSPDHLEAVRFSRKVDAERVMTGLSLRGKWNPHVVEHMWIPKKPPTPSPDPCVHGFDPFWKCGHCGMGVGVPEGGPAPSCGCGPGGCKGHSVSGSPASPSGEAEKQREWEGVVRRAQHVVAVKWCGRKDPPENLAELVLRIAEFARDEVDSALSSLRGERERLQRQYADDHDRLEHENQELRARAEKAEEAMRDVVKLAGDVLDPAPPAPAPAPPPFFHRFTCYAFCAGCECECHTLTVAREDTMERLWKLPAPPAQREDAPTPDPKEIKAGCEASNERALNSLVPGNDAADRHIPAPDLEGLIRETLSGIAAVSKAREYKPQAPAYIWPGTDAYLPWLRSMASEVARLTREPLGAECVRLRGIIALLQESDFRKGNWWAEAERKLAEVTQERDLIRDQRDEAKANLFDSVPAETWRQLITDFAAAGLTNLATWVSETFALHAARAQEDALSERPADPKAGA